MIDVFLFGINKVLFYYNKLVVIVDGDMIVWKIMSECIWGFVKVWWDR